MKRTLFTAICLVSISTLAQAACPAGLTNPLQLINGHSWVFQTSSDGNEIGQASIGKFTSTFTPPAASGTLSVTATMDFPTEVVPEMAFAGRYQINPDCSGGTLYFDSSYDPMQLTFVFANSFTEMYLVSTESGSNSLQNWGTAKVLATPVTCPAGITSPLDVVKNTTFGFGLSPATTYFVGPAAAVGVSTLSEALSRGTNPVTVGVVNGTVTLMPYFGPPTTQISTAGIYTVDPDCSGGTIFFGSSVLPQQFQYIFANAAFSELYLLSLDPTNPYGGHAKKF